MSVPGPAGRTVSSGGVPSSPRSSVVDGVDVDAVAAAVAACAGVSELSGGRFGEIATYLPGRRVAGVTVSADTVTVQVRARWGRPVDAMFAEVLAAAGSMLKGKQLALVVTDVDDPPGTATAPVVRF